MNVIQNERYLRQIILPNFGEIGQKKLAAARVLIIGVGGLGSIAAMYLASTGVGKIILSDYDRVEISNLHRQIAHRNVDLGRLKVASARDTLLALNPEIEVIAIPYVLENDELATEIAKCNVVIDACDNFETRFALNIICHQLSVPLISGAATGMLGQITLFTYQSETACYQCLYPNIGNNIETCSNSGIFPPLVGIIGASQAAETIKLILGMGESLSGKLLLFDAMSMEWRTLNLKRDPACTICGMNYGLS